MTTVGYGDVTAQNNLEKMVNVVMMVLACASFGYIINKLSGILDEIDKKQLQYHRELNILNKFMENNNIKQDLRMKVRNYFKTFLKTNSIQQFDQEKEVLVSKK